MKKIRFKKLEIVDFQGVRDLSFNFGENTTKIEGTNGVGKSTIIDAILWVITGKNSRDEADSNFKIMPLDVENNIIEGIKPSVRLTIEVEGKEHLLERALKISFKKLKDGSIDRTKAPGKKSILLFDNVELGLNQYNAKLVDLITDIDTFKLLSNATHFLGNINEKEQRELMLQYINPVTHEQLCTVNEDYKSLTELEDLEFSDVLLSTRKQLRDTEDRIVELSDFKKGQQKSLIAINLSEDTDFEMLLEQKKMLQKELFEMRDSNSNAIKHQSEVNRLQNEKTNLRNKIIDFDADFNKNKNFKIRQLEFKLETIENKISDGEATRTSLLSEYQTLKTRKDNIKADVDDEIAKEFNEYKENAADAFNERIKDIDSNIESLKVQEKELINKDVNDKCYVCEQDLPAEKIFEQQSNINVEIESVNKKIKELEELKVVESDKLNKAIEQKEQTLLDASKRRIEKNSIIVQELIDTNKTKGLALKSELTSLKELKIKIEEEIKIAKALEPDSNEKEKIQNDILEIEQSLSEFGNVELYSSEQMNQLQDEIDKITQQTASKENLDAIQNEIEKTNLEIENTKIAVAKLETKKLLLDDYLKLKNELLSDSIKEYFSDDITFKFTEFTKDGTPKDVFKLLVNGIDYQNVNTAGKIKAGIQMINFFKSKMNIQVPILIDNKESIVVDLPEFEGQMVTCRAVENKKLEIKGE